MTSYDKQSLAPSLPAIFFITLMIFSAMMPRVLLAPLLLRISDTLGLTYDRASLFFLSSSAGFFTGLLSSGFVTQRVSHKRTIVASVFLTGISVVVLSQVQSVAWFHILLFSGGWAIGLYPGSGIVSITTIAPDAHRGKALAIHECGPNATFILAPVIAAALAPVIGWRGVMLIVGSSAILVSLLFAGSGKASNAHGLPPSFGNLAQLARNRSFWVVSALFAVASIAAMGVYGVLPTYLMVEHGLPERFVNNLVGASRISSFAAILTAGGLADRLGFRPVVTVILIVTGIATMLLGLSSGPLLLVGVFLQPLIVGAYFPVALNALSKVTSPELRSLAVALAIPLANLVGAGIAPPLLSAAGARGWFPQAFVVLGVLIIASIALLPLMQRTDTSRG